jgi:propanol-preferring alcohol dehydrogenase
MNACMETRNRFTPPPTPGSSAGVDGGMADFMLVPSMYVVPIGDLDPAVGAILADAALTSLHAVRSVQELLTPGSTVVVIGVGGVGHIAVQILKAMTPATIIALDVNEAALSHVRDHAEHAWVVDDSTTERVMKATGRRGADAVLDVVGSSETLQLAAGLVAAYGAIRAIGLGGGEIPFQARWGKASVPWGVSFARPYSGTLQDMADAVALARTAAIRPLVTRYPLSEWERVFDMLEAGQVRGRAVLVPEEA